MFREYGAMFIHLESGACASGVDRKDINQWMRTGYNCGRYVRDGGLPVVYICPECDRHFTSTSGLLQHVESNSCNEDVDDVMRDISQDVRF